MKYRIFTLVLLLSLICGVSVDAQKVGASSMQFLKVMPTARATAMADAYAALTWGADAVFWNPAGLIGVKSHELTTSYLVWLFDTKQSAVGYGMSLGDFGSIGAQFQYVDYGSIEETRVDYLGFDASGNYNPGLTGRTFSPKSWLVGITYAKQLTSQFSTGLTAKYAHESLWSDGTATAADANGAPGSYDTYASVLLFDFGMNYNTGFRTVRIGASVQNFGPQVRFASESFPAPLTFRIGIVADLLGRDALLVPSEQSRLTVAYDIMHPNDYDQQMHVGMEYWFANVAAVRVGRKFNYDNEAWTLGFGVRTDVVRVGLGLDYSYASMGTYLGNVHRFTLGASF